MTKLLALVAIVVMVAVPSLLNAQADKEAVFVPKKDDVIKTWTVTKSFDIGGVSKTFTFTLSRIVTTEPEMKPYIYPKEEQGDHSTWQEGVTITGPTTPVDLGYFTVRATGKFYKAIPPVEITKTVKEPGTGWKRGMTVIRSK